MSGNLGYNIIISYKHEENKLEGNAVIDNNCDYISYDGVVTLEQITPQIETNTQLHSLSLLTRPLERVSLITENYQSLKSGECLKDK